MSSFCYDAADKMAEFKAIVTASFDDIGSNVALANITNGPPLRPNRLVTSAAAPPSSPATDKCTRRNPFSFLRKVKSHAASLLSSYTKLNPSPPHSFVPSLPSRAPTPVPFASSLPRNVLASASGKHLHHPADVLDSEPKSSFFDDDDDDDDDEYHVNRPVCPPPRRRRLSSALARSNSRLSSAIAAAPVFLGLSSHSVSTPYLVAENNDVVRPELAHSSKSSLRLKLRTKFSLPKLTSSRSHLSSSSTDPSPVTPSYYSHPYSTVVFPDFDDTQLCRALLEDRFTTPEEDPFRRDVVVHSLVANRRYPSSSPQSGSLDGDSDTDKELTGSHYPILSSRWSSDSESPPSSLNHKPIAGGRRGPAACASTAPSQGPNRCPLSLTFPLPPSAQKGEPLPGVTVHVTPPTPGPPPSYFPPQSPPPSCPLPPVPPIATTITSRSRPSTRLEDDISRRTSRRNSARSMAKSTPIQAGQIQRRRSHLRMDKPLDLVMLQPLEEHPDVAKRTQRKGTPRRRERPVTPFPLLPARQDPTGRLEASKAVTGFTRPCQDSVFDQSVDAIPDSEVEPDRNLDSDKARKKMSVSSATSAQTTASTTSTTSVSTTTSFASVATALTAATTVSPSTSPNIGVDKPSHVSQVPVTDQESRIVDASTHTPSSLPTSPPPTNVDARSPGIYIEQEGTMHGASSDLFLARGEHVIICASGWSEFRSYCDTCHDVSVCLSGSSYGSVDADVLIVEVQRAGKTCGVELRIVASPHSSTDFPGRIPGSYPLSSDPVLPVNSCVSPIDIPQSVRSQWKESLLGLDGVPPFHEAGRSTTPRPSQSALTPDSRPEDEDQLRTVLAFTATLPTTLRDLVKRAGEMSLFDGVGVATL